jgi:hypothetical protein
VALRLAKQLARVDFAIGGVMKLIAAIGFILLSCSACLPVKEGLVGGYSGYFVTPRGVREYLVLEIQTAQDGMLKAKATRHYSGTRLVAGAGMCMGDYTLEGTYKDNKIDLRSVAPGGAAGDCRMTLRLAVEGDKLTGTMGKLRTELTKR